MIGLVFFIYLCEVIKRYTMKKMIFLMVLLMSVSSMKAQQTASSTSIRYEQRHVVCTNSKGEMNVIDIDFEWPERLCYVAQPVLLQHINTLLGDTCMQLDRKIAAIQSLYGEPLTTKLDTIPDDSKFCYASYSVREVGLQEGRYISMRVEKNIQPGLKSSLRKEHQLDLFVYDIPSQRILKGKELMKLENILVDPVASYYLSNALTEGLLNNYAVSLDAQKLYGPVPVNDKTLLMEVGAEGQPSVQSMISTADWVNFLTSKMKKLLKIKPVVGTPVVELVDAPVVGDSMYVHRQTEDLASFSWNNQNLNQYITTNLVVPPYLKKEALSGRALVRLIIERDGTLSNISIVKPFSPTLDRNIVALLRRMPKWSPARQEGRPVRSFCFIPVNVKLQ